jgi:hypothetical protein
VSAGFRAAHILPEEAGFRAGPLSPPPIPKESALTAKDAEKGPEKPDLQSER